MRSTFIWSAALLLLTACGGEEEKAVESIELKTEKQKMSYVVGADNARQLVSDPGFADYDKEQILLGFEEGLKNESAFDIQCQQVLQRMFGDGQGTIDATFKTDGSRCIGKLFGANFVRGWKQEDFIAKFDLEYVKIGFKSALEKTDTIVSQNDREQIMRNLVSNLNERLFTKSLKKEAVFFDKVKTIPGVKEITGGIFVETIRQGTGASPQTGDDVLSHYVLMSPNGDTLQSTLGREPVPFSLNGVIQGWSIAFPTLKKGGKYKLYIPQALAYGGNPPDASIEAFSPLAFYVELIDFGKPGSLTGGPPQQLPQMR